MKYRFFKYVIFFFLLLTGFSSYSAEKIDLVFNKDILNQAKNQSLNGSNYHAVFGLSQKESLKEIRSVTDKNGVVHTRYSQTVRGVPVWGEQIIISRDQSGNVTALHGQLVKGLGKELANLTPAFSSDTALNLMKETVKKASSVGDELKFKNESSDLVIYLDDQIPKLAYSVSFFADSEYGGNPTRPFFLVDATDKSILFQYEGLTHTAISLLNESNVSSSIRTWHFYKVTVDTNPLSLYITTAGSNGDADLYVRFGSEPTLSSYDCRSIGSDSNEACGMNNPQAGDWYIGIYAYRRYDGLNLSVKTFDSVNDGTGPGGNQKTGEYSYGSDYPAFEVLQDVLNCMMNNENVKTVDLNHGTSGAKAYEYNDESNDGSCTNTHKVINGAYSPLNDAHYFGGVVYKMYNDWIGGPPLTFQLSMRVHYSTNYENAFWDGSSMTFGDGYNTFYPLVSLDVSAHEVSHGFTEQNSGLVYSNQSGGINEAFSDMAGEAAEFYMKGSNDFLVGAEIYKASGKALRYMCNPPQDGKSIDSAEDYYGGLDVHYSSGVFNKAFCLLAQSSGWTTQSAFQTFAKANMDYWTPNVDFETAARGVYDAANDLEFAGQDVVDAFCGVDVIIPDHVCSVTNQPPTVSITSPSNGATVSNSVDLIANASDLDGNVTSVEFFVGESSVGLDNVVSDGWSISWDSTQVSDGSHIITAKATDNDSAVTTSAGVSVTVNNGTTTSSPVTTALLDQSASGSRGRWNAIALVTVTGDASVNGLTVSGSWSNGANGSGNCTTDASGTCQIAKQNIKSNVASVTFTIDSVTDSNGSVVITGESVTSINLMQP